jgi:hypothetical protein
VVVNPNSGPSGSAGDQLPGDDYVREVPKLNSFPNVVTVGYVLTGWANRSLDETYKDIQIYAGWSKHHDIEGLYVQGIYLDETPHHVSDKNAMFLDALRLLIKNCDGLQGDRLVRYTCLIFFFTVDPLLHSVSAGCMKKKYALPMHARRRCQPHFPSRLFFFSLSWRQHK